MGRETYQEIGILLCKARPQLLLLPFIDLPFAFAFYCLRIVCFCLLLLSPFLILLKILPINADRKIRQIKDPAEKDPNL
jgi:hypothetical protein